MDNTLEQKIKEIAIGLAQQDTPVSPEKIQEIVNAYREKYNQPSGEDSNKNKTAPSPSVDSDGISTDSYINSTFWDLHGLDRSFYFDEEGNL